MNLYTGEKQNKTKHHLWLNSCDPLYGNILYLERITQFGEDNFNHWGNL